MGVIHIHLDSDRVQLVTHTSLNRYDPTRTTVLRNTFVAEVNRRFKRLKRKIIEAIVTFDVFGLNQKPIVQASVVPRQFAFPRSSDKVSAFMDWLNRQIQEDLLDIREFEQIGKGVEEFWTNKYVYDSYKRGVMRARYEMKKAGYSVPSIDESGGISAVINGTPFHIDRLGLLYTRVYSELRGITSQMEQQIARILAQGIADGDNPKLLARKLVATISGPVGDLGITDTLGRFIPAQRRAQILARTEIIRAHHVATIREYRNWELEGVKVQGEWKTAGDNRVCEVCAELEGKIYSLDEIEPMIPRHPQCRCVALPVPKEFGKVIEPTPTKKFSVPKNFNNTFRLGNVRFKFANLTDKEMEALKEYQRGLYSSKIGGFPVLQRYLREGTIPDWVKKEGVRIAKVKEYAENLKSALSKAVIDEDVVVYRGIRNPLEAFGIGNIDELKEGLVFTSNGVVSTTTSQKIAKKFAEKLNFWEDPKIIRIHLKKGQTAFPMDMIKDIGEKEVVLPPGSKFKVVKVRGNVIDVELIQGEVRKGIETSVWKISENVSEAQKQLRDLAIISPDFGYIKLIGISEKQGIKYINHVGNDLVRIHKKYPKLDEYIKGNPIRGFVFNLAKKHDLDLSMGSYVKANRQIILFRANGLVREESISHGARVWNVGKGSFQSVLRHEYGHHITHSLPSEKKQLFIRFFKDNGKEYFKKYVSGYAGSNGWGEAFAESFSLLTNPKYEKGMLPKELEEILEEILK